MAVNEGFLQTWRESRHARVISVGMLSKPKKSWFSQVLGLIWVGIVLILWQRNILKYKQELRTGKDKFCFFSCCGFTVQCEREKWRRGVVVVVQFHTKCLSLCWCGSDAAEVSCQTAQVTTGVGLSLQIPGRNSWPGMSTDTFLLRKVSDNGVELLKVQCCSVQMETSCCAGARLGLEMPHFVDVFIVVSLTSSVASSTDIFAWRHQLRTSECFALPSLASLCSEFTGLNARMFLKNRDLEAWNDHRNMFLNVH